MHREHQEIFNVIPISRYLLLADSIDILSKQQDIHNSMFNYEEKKQVGSAYLKQIQNSLMFLPEEHQTSKKLKAKAEWKMTQKSLRRLSMFK